MNKNIGFRRNIYRAWLDAAAAIAADEPDPARVRERLDAIVAEQIGSNDSRRMALDVLLHIWMKTAESHPALHAEAHALYQEFEAPDDRLWIHYGLTLLAYPFFRLGAATIGQMADNADVFTPKDVKKRMTAQLGQLGALEKATERIVFSLRNWGILTPTRQRYAYAPRLHGLTTDEKRLQTWLLAVAITAHPADTLPFVALSRMPELFPFRITISVEDLRRSRHFEVHREGMAWDMISLRCERGKKHELGHVSTDRGNRQGNGDKTKRVTHSTVAPKT